MKVFEKVFTRCSKDTFNSKGPNLLNFNSTFPHHTKQTDAAVASFCKEICYKFFLKKTCEDDTGLQVPGNDVI